MRPIRVRQPHALTIAEVRRRVEHALARAQERHHVIWRWVDGVLEVFPPPGIAAGARGRLVLSEEAVHAEVELPRAYRLVKGTVETRLAQGLEELLTC